MKPSASETLVRPSVATEVSLPIGDLRLTGELTLPAAAQGIVLFAHGSGSSRLSPRNQFVARRLQSAGLGTLLFDLLTPAEERKDQNSGFWRFDINLLAQRLIAVTRWLLAQPATPTTRPRLLRLQHRGRRCPRCGRRTGHHHPRGGLARRKA